MLLERDIHDRRVLSLTSGGGTQILFTLESLTDSQKIEITDAYDKEFPSPPVKVKPSPIGNIVAFDLTDPAYRGKLLKWQSRLGMAYMAETLGVPVKHMEQIEDIFPQNVISELQTTAQLLNGVQSDPLINLVRDAMWAPEVLTWLETYVPEDQDFTITDTPLFREMEVIVAAGLTREMWSKFSARDRIVYLSWWDAKNAKEGFLNWNTFTKGKDRKLKKPLPGAGR